MVNPGKSNNNNGALDLPLPAQYIVVALERNFISTDPTSHITWEVFASNFNMNFLVSIQLVEAFSPKNVINAKKIIKSAKWVFLNFKNLTHLFNSYIVKSWKFESIRIRQTEVPTTYWPRLAHETLSWLKREKAGLLFLALAKVQNLTNSHNIHLWNWPEKQNFNSEPSRVLRDTVLLWFSKYLLFTRPALQNA